jgi:hypothetical protein
VIAFFPNETHIDINYNYTYHLTNKTYTVRTFQIPSLKQYFYMFPPASALCRLSCGISLLADQCAADEGMLSKNISVASD